METFSTIFLSATSLIALALIIGVLFWLRHEKQRMAAVDDADTAKKALFISRAETWLEDALPALVTQAENEWLGPQSGILKKSAVKAALLKIAPPELIEVLPDSALDSMIEAALDTARSLWEELPGVLYKEQELPEEAPGQDEEPAAEESADAAEAPVAEAAADEPAAEEAAEEPVAEEAADEPADEPVELAEADVPAPKKSRRQKRQKAAAVDAPADEAATDDAPADEAATDAPADEAATDDAPAEEAATDDAPAEDPAPKQSRRQKRKAAKSKVEVASDESAADDAPADETAADDASAPADEALEGEDDAPVEPEEDPSIAGEE